MRLHGRIKTKKEDSWLHGRISDALRAGVSRCVAARQVSEGKVGAWPRHPSLALVRNEARWRRGEIADEGGAAGGGGGGWRKGEGVEGIGVG